MTLREINVPPDHDTYNFGVGVDSLSGTGMGLVVNPTPSSPITRGAIQSFDVSRISSTQDLQQSLGIDVNASYGASFGAGVSARFSFCQKSQVHASSLFMTINAMVHFADQSIVDCVLTQTASQHVDRPDIFAGRYGDTFIHACQSGGLFVGLIRVETFEENLATQIEGELKGTYGLFNADAQTTFSNVKSKYNVDVYCSAYAEGGPAIQIKDPSDPKELLALANTWMAAMFADPNQYSRTYQWTLSPTSIAEGPLPLNQADIEHSHDVLVFCAQERATLLDQLNQLNWWLQHQGKYDWTGSTTPGQIAEAARATQSDLDTVAACASAAIDTPKQALMPADYAAAQVPPKKYPLSQPPPIEPKPLPGTPAVVTVPDFINFTPDDHIDTGLERSAEFLANTLGLHLDVTVQNPDAVPDNSTATGGHITSQSPPAGTKVPQGSTISLTVFID